MHSQTNRRIKVLNLKGPLIDRSFRLNMMGDWGQANLHTVCGWIGQEIAERAGPHTRFAIWNGRGWYDGMRALARGEVDLAVVTPASAVRMIFAGRAFAQEDFSSLRAIASIPQWDRLAFAVDSALGVRSFAEIRGKKPPLKIATCPDDGENLIGWAVRRLMEFAGIDISMLEAWGGGYLEYERPTDAFAAVRAGAANAVFHEAIMGPWWQDFANERERNFIPLEEDALARMETVYDWPRSELPAGYFRGLSQPLPALDFSDFVVLVRCDLPEDVAHLMAWCACETRGNLERRFSHIPRERSPVTYPLQPEQMARTPVPLHDGAERYYREAGIL